MNSHIIEQLWEKLTYFPKGVSAILFERVPVENNSKFKVYEPKYFTSIPKSKVQKFAVFSNKLILSKFLYDIPLDLITPAAKYLANIHIANGYHSRMINQLWDEFRDWLAEDEKRRNKLMELLAFADLGIKAFKIDVKETSLQRFYLHTNVIMVIKELKISIFLSIMNLMEPVNYSFLVVKSCNHLKVETRYLWMKSIGFHTYISSFILDIFRDKEINKKNAQLILTTHDINLLDEDKLRRDQIWFTEKSEKGTSDLFSLSDFSGVREDTLLQNGMWQINLEQYLPLNPYKNYLQMRLTDTKQARYSMLLICEGTHTEPNFLELMIEDFKEAGIIDFATTIKPKPTISPSDNTLDLNRGKEKRRKRLLKNTTQKQQEMEKSIFPENNL